MKFIAPGDLIRSHKMKNTGAENDPQTTNQHSIKTQDYKLHLFDTIVEKSPLSGWKEREQAPPTIIISLNPNKIMLQETP